MEDKIEEGSYVFVNSYDVQGVGVLESNQAGYHVKLIGDDHTLYFDYKEVYPLPVYDVIVDSPYFDWCKYGAAELGSILFTFDIKPECDLYKAMKARLHHAPYSITILHN